MNVEKWLRYFETRQAATGSIPWDAPLPEQDPGWTAMRHLLPQLSAGEGTEGALGDDLASQTEDEGYAACLRAYAQEEVQHGVLVERLCERYRVTAPEQGDWIIRLVIWLVNLGPLLMRVLMLYTGEVVAAVLMLRVKQSSPDPVIRAAFQAILTDERGHIAFHGDRVRSALRAATPWQRFWIIAGHRVGFALITTLLYLENRHAFRVYGDASFSSWLEECRELRDQTATGVLGALRGRHPSHPDLPGSSPIEAIGA